MFDASDPCAALGDAGTADAGAIPATCEEAAKANLSCLASTLAITCDERGFSGTSQCASVGAIYDRGCTQ